MAGKQSGRDGRNMTEGQMFEELIGIHARAAGEAISSLLNREIVISNPEVRDMAVRDVEYGILEPAIFIKSCLTSNMAGNTVMIMRQRDMQAFLNELMGSDELPDPDYVFDEVAMSAAGQLMNQMVHASASAMAGYLGNTMDFADCQLLLSDGAKDLAYAIGEAREAKILAIHYRLEIKDIMESEFIECFSETALDSLFQELEAKKKRMTAESREPERTQTAAKQRTAVPEYETAAPMKKPAGYQDDLMGASRGGSLESGKKTIHKNLGLIMDVPLSVSVEIGKTKRRLKDVLNFNNGMVVELDKQADAPVDIIVNGQLIARGEVVVIDDNFGVRISEIVNTRSIIGNGELS